MVTQHSKTCLSVFSVVVSYYGCFYEIHFLYWSKRRRVHNNVADNFATILSSPGGLVKVGGIVEIILFEMLVKNNSYI